MYREHEHKKRMPLHWCGLEVHQISNLDLSFGFFSCLYNFFCQYLLQKLNLCQNIRFEGYTQHKSNAINQV